MNPVNSLKVYCADWVLPVTTAPIQDGAVAVEGTKIVFVGSRSAAPDGEVVQLGAAILLPGLVNTHTHLELTAMRGYLECLEFPAWIDKLRSARNSILVDEALLHSSLVGVAEGIEAGVTTYADTSSSGESMNAMLHLKVRGVMYQETFGPDPKHCAPAIEDLTKRLDHFEPKQTDLVKLGVSPHAPYTVSDELYQASVKLAESRDLPVAMHISEGLEEGCYVRFASGGFADRHRERGMSVRSRGESPIEMLYNLGVLSDRTLLIHAVQADATEIDIVARQNCSLAHCPVSNAKLGHGIAPIIEFLDAGVSVGFGSDSVASNNKMDLLEEARVAILFQNARLKSPLAMTPQRALELLTIDGAKALGLSDRIGSLETGKDADLVAFPLDLLKTTPCIDPVATLIFSLGGAKSVLTVVAGRELLKDGKHCDFDVDVVESVHLIGKALAGAS